MSKTAASASSALSDVFAFLNEASVIESKGDVENIHWGTNGITNTILVTGSRRFGNHKQIHDTLRPYIMAALAANDLPVVLVTGAAAGADTIAEFQFTAIGQSLPIEQGKRLFVKSVPVTNGKHDSQFDWKNHITDRCGKACKDDPSYCRVVGVVRSEYMVDTYKPDVVLAFYVGGGDNGTDACVNYAEEAGCLTKRVMQETSIKSEDVTVRHAGRVIDPMDPFANTNDL